MASEYITKIAISTTPERVQELHGLGYQKINVNLNQGTKSSTSVYMWYRKGTGEPLTRLQFSFTDEMDDVLRRAGFTELMFFKLWCSSGASPKYNIPIVDMAFTFNEKEEADHFKLGWEMLPCNLNFGYPIDCIYLWVKRESKTYICDVAATVSVQQEDVNLFKKGYIRMDEDLNRGSGGKPIFLWYRQSTTVCGGITEMDVSITPADYSSRVKRGFTLVDVNLNEGTSGLPVYVWIKKDGSLPIKALTITSNNKEDCPYKEAGLILIDKNLNAGNSGTPLFLWYGK